MTKMDLTNESGATIPNNDISSDCKTDVIAPYNSSRGLRGCIMDSWRIFAFNCKRYASQLAVSALLGGVGMALLFWTISKIYADHALPATLLEEAGFDNTVVSEVMKLQTTDYFLLIAALIGYIACWVIAKGLLWTQVSTYRKQDCLGSKRWLLPNRETLRTSLRLLTYDAILCVAIAIPAGIIALIAFLTHWLHALWAILPVIIFIGVLAIPGRDAYLMENCNIVQALRETWKKGIHYWGGFFLVSLLTSIPLAAVAIALILPYTTFPLSYFADTTSVITGEESGLPTFFTALSFAVAIIGFGATFFITTLQTWALTLKSAAANYSSSAKSGRQKES